VIQGLIAPPPGTLIDWSNGLANKLLIAGLPTTGGWWDALQKPTSKYVATGGSFGIGQFGSKRVHSATSDKFTLATGQQLPTKATTLLVIYAKRDTTNRGAGVVGFTSGSDGTRRYGLHAPYSDGNVYWDYGGSTNNVSRLTVAGQTWVAGVPSVWLFTSGPRGMEAWRDGKKIGSNAANPTRLLDASVFTWALGTNGNTISDLLDFYGLAVWNRQLEPGEIDLLSGDPFAIYQRQRSLAYRSSALFAPPASGRRRQVLCC
jgi:hypothetical protein